MKEFIRVFDGKHIKVKLHRTLAFRVETWDDGFGRCYSLDFGPLSIVASFDGWLA